MASAPSPSFPAKTSEAVSPTTSQISPPPPSPALSAPPPQPLSPPPPISQPNATPDLSPPPASPPLSPPPPLLSPPPPPLPSPSPPPPVTLSPPPPVPTAPTVSAPPPKSTAPPPPVTTSPPLSPPILSSPPPSLSPPPPSPSTPVPAEATVPPPKSSPFSPPPPKKRTPSSSLSSPPPPSPSLSTSPPLPSPNANTSISKTPPPVSQFPLASPTSQNGTTSEKNPNSNKNSGIYQGGNNNSSGNGGLSMGALISIAIITVFLLGSFIVAGIWYVKKKRKPVNGYNSVFVMPSPITTATASPKLESPLTRYPPTPFAYNSGSQNIVNSKYFSYDELHDITNGFSVNNVLGEGGFGCVYKGCLADGREVAVKRLTSGSDQGEREFQAEVEIISRVHHRHLVSLVGYCIEKEQRVLVYDYVPNNSLHYHLHGNDRSVLEWSIRVKVAAGAARGIAYLHEDCHPRIIHRDIKSSNILLDSDFEALVADFGLARLALDAATHVTTRVMGTFGYLAPEYASSGKLTERSDVFSFGVVLLELITGRKPVDTSRPLGDESLVEWARPLLSQALETGKFDEIIDPKLESNYNEAEMIRMIEAAAACVRHSASRRPRMSQVVRVLDSLADVDLTNGVQPGKSELFNVANSAEIRLFQRMAFGNFDSSDFSQTSSSLNSNSHMLGEKDYRRL